MKVGHGGTWAVVVSAPVAGRPVSVCIPTVRSKGDHGEAWIKVASSVVVGYHGTWELMSLLLVSPWCRPSSQLRLVLFVTLGLPTLRSRYFRKADDGDD
jgi:hypothetical protein